MANKVNDYVMKKNLPAAPQFLLADSIIISCSLVFFLFVAICVSGDNELDELVACLLVIVVTNLVLFIKFCLLLYISY